MAVMRTDGFSRERRIGGLPSIVPGWALILIAACWMVLSPLPVRAQIAGSPHDFSSQGWSEGEICKPCHTPHHADAAVTAAPLWNHEVTTATYTLYSSPTMDVDVEQPGEVSKLCLSCHDGTVAMDSFGGKTGGMFMSGPAVVGEGLDLSDDHPVGIYWDHQTVSGCGSCHYAHGDPYSYKVRFYNRRVECASCHDPHNNGAEDSGMLRVGMAGSELCLECHTDK